MVLNNNVEAYIIYINNLAAKIIIYEGEKASISFSLTKQAIILADYLDFTHVFLKNSAKILH